VSSRESQPNSIGEVLERIFQRLDPPDRRGIYRIWSFWADEVGEAIAARAQPAGYHRGILSVRVTSHAWMQELQFLKEDIRQRLNTRLGREQIRDIYFVAGSPDPLSGGVGSTGGPPPDSVAEGRAVPIPLLRDHRLTEAFERVAEAHARRRRIAPKSDLNPGTEGRRPSRS
jgi:hypothetical protein